MVKTMVLQRLAGDGHYPHPFEPEALGKIDVFGTPADDVLVVTIDGGEI